MATITLTADIAQVAALSERLDRLAGDQIEAVAVGVVNEVVDRAYDLTRSRMNQELSLSDAYLNRRLTVTKAQQGQRPRATILADGSLTKLGHFNPRVITQAVKNPDRSRGNPALGIQPGQKAQAVTVAVRRGQRKAVRAQSNDTFMIPRFRDSEGNPLIFRRVGDAKTRTGKDKLVSLVGPSVYQLFRYQIAQPQVAQAIEDDLGNTLADRAEAALLDALE